MNSLEKMMNKKRKEGKQLDPMHASAKESVLHELRSMAADHMGKKLDGLKKVSVASDSPEGLQAGLEKAQEMVQQHDDAVPNDHSPMHEEMNAAEHEVGEREGEESPEHESQESPEEEQAEHEQPAEEAAEDSIEDDGEYRHMSEDELDQKLNELLKHKERMKASKA